MSYFDKLEAIKSTLNSQISEATGLSEGLQNTADELLSSKVKHIGEQLESFAGLGLAAYKSFGSAKSLYKKYSSPQDKEQEESKEQEPEQEPEEPSMEQDIPSGEPEESGELNVPENLPENTEDLADIQEPETLGGETLAGESELGMPGTMTEMTNFNELGTSIEHNIGNTTLQTTENGLSETSIQNQIMDLDPETTNSLLNTGQSLTNAVEDVSDTVGDVVAGVSDTVASTAETVGLAVGEAVLDSIPVVGELALVGTAIAGVFESIFGEKKPSIPSVAISTTPGIDIGSLVQQTPIGVEV